MSTGQPHLDLSSDSPLREFLTFRLARVQSKLNAQASYLLAEVAGLSLAQWRIVALLGSIGQTNSSNLSRLSGIDKGLMSRKLKSLVKDGLVVSRTDKNDNRVHKLRLTPKGVEVFNETLPEMQKRQNMLRATLSEEEQSLFESVLDKLDAAAEHRAF